MSEVSKDRGGQGLAITGLILGIASIVLSVLGYFAIILGVAAVIFGAVSLKSAGRNKAKAGIITGVVGIILSIIVVTVVHWGIAALQGSQRDTARKSDIATLASDITSYQSNNRGQLPDSTSLSTSDLLYVTGVTESGSPTIETAVYETGVDCSGDATSSSGYAIRILLESGSEYCQEY